MALPDCPRRRRAAWIALAALTLSGVLTACDADAGPDELRIIWTERTLPAHPGAPGRTVVRDAVQCGNEWYVVGAVFLSDPTETQDTRPAAWSSADGRSWAPLPVRADTYWGARGILNSTACSRGRLAVVGARSGGAHGNPRVTTFHLDSSGTLVDVEAVFTQYGGVSATNVGPVSGGPAGWLIAGNRVSGPAVWVTDDPSGFTLVEAEPGLTDDGDLESLAQAGTWSGDEWVLVGAGARTGRQLDRDPLAWTSANGLAWTPQHMPAAPETEDVHRVVRLPDGRLLAVGVRGETYAVWTRDQGQWTESTPFGALAEDRRAAPYVASLAHTTVGALATLSTGIAYQLWHTEDGTTWRQVEAPVAPDVAGDHTLVVARGDDLVLLTDDGTAARVWTGRAWTGSGASDADPG